MGIKRDKFFEQLTSKIDPLGLPPPFKVTTVLGMDVIEDSMLLGVECPDCHVKGETVSLRGDRDQLDFCCACGKGYKINREVLATNIFDAYDLHKAQSESMMNMYKSTFRGGYGYSDKLSVHRIEPRGWKRFWWYICFKPEKWVKTRIKGVEYVLPIP